jgi:hypothetical protein
MGTSGQKSFSCIVLESSHDVDGRIFPVFQVDVFGAIIVPYDKYPVRYQVQLVDVTDGQDKILPVFCAWDGLKNESDCFEFNGNTFHIPYTNSVISKPITVCKIPLESLIFARKGPRSLVFFVRLIDAKNKNEIASAGAEIAYIAPEAGYQDKLDIRIKAIGLTVRLALMVCAAGKNMDDRATVQIIHKWSESQAKRYSDDAMSQIVKLCQDVTKETLRDLRSKGGIRIKPFCEEIRETVTIAEILDALELCLKVIGADKKVDASELNFVMGIAHWLGIESDRLRAMIDKHVPGMTAGHIDSAEHLLGIDPGMTPEQIKAVLAKSFKKYNAQVVNTVAEKRIHAEQMLQLIVSMRQKYLATD